MTDNLWPDAGVCEGDPGCRRSPGGRPGLLDVLIIGSTARCHLASASLPGRRILAVIAGFEHTFTHARTRN